MLRRRNASSEASLRKVEMRRAGWFLVAAVLLVGAGCGSVSPGNTRSSTPIPSASASAPIAGVPEARQGGFLVEDPGRGQLLLIGGIGSSAMVGSTWSWDGRRWSQLNAPAQGIDMVFLDSVRNQVIALQATGPTAYGTATWSGTWA